MACRSSATMLPAASAPPGAHVGFIAIGPARACAGARRCPRTPTAIRRRQITIMPLLAPGTGLDITVRLYAEQMAQSFGKPVVVENRPGSAGLVGIAALKAAPADGYTLDGRDQRRDGDPPGAARSRCPTTPQKDFVPIALYVKSPFILVVNPKLPIHSVPELIKYVKERPGPDQLQLVRRRRRAAPVARIHEAAVRLRCRARALSQQPAVDRRRRGRPRRTWRSPRPARRCR